MSNMLKECLEAPTCVAKLMQTEQELYASLGAQLRKHAPNVVATIARGSSDNAATYAQYLIPMTVGSVVASVPLSVVTVLKSKIQFKGQMVIALSQSGASPDTLATFEELKKSAAISVAIVNNASSPLAKSAPYLLLQHAGVETSIAATKTVICTMAALAKVVAHWSEDQFLLKSLSQLPDDLRRASSMGEQIAKFDWLTNSSHVYVISRGLGLSVAQEVALKLKETCGVQAEAFSAAEVRHGPREIVDRNFRVLAIALPGSGEDDVIRVSQDLKSQGAQVMLFAPSNKSSDVSLPDCFDIRLMPIVALQMIYPWLANLSVKMGRNPDQPRVLQSKIVETI